MYFFCFLLLLTSFSLFSLRLPQLHVLYAQPLLGGVYEWSRLTPVKVSPLFAAPLCIFCSVCSYFTRSNLCICASRMSRRLVAFCKSLSFVFIFPRGARLYAYSFAARSAAARPWRASKSSCYAQSKSGRVGKRIVSSLPFFAKLYECIPHTKRYFRLL